MGVVGPGKVPWPALMAGPYVPLCLLRKCLWVRGVPTCSQNKGPLHFMQILVMHPPDTAAAQELEKQELEQAVKTWESLSQVSIVKTDVARM